MRAPGSLRALKSCCLQGADGFGHFIRRFWSHSVFTLKTALQEKIAEFILGPKAGSWALDCFHLALLDQELGVGSGVVLLLGFIWPLFIPPALSLISVESFWQETCFLYRPTAESKRLPISADLLQVDGNWTAVRVWIRDSPGAELLLYVPVSGGSGDWGVAVCSVFTLCQQQGSAIQTLHHPGTGKLVINEMFWLLEIASTERT